MTKTTKKTIRIGNGQGFWGDNVDAPVELLRGGPIDYIGMDYLAEVTLSIMMRQKLKNPKLGYATDFIGFIRRVLPELKERNVRVLTNAGGLNPKACRNRIFEVARELGVTGLRVGVVDGDDLLPRLPELIAAGHTLKNMDTGEPLAPLVDKVMSANAYLGARPIVEALGQGAQIVLCGRVTDTALALAPMIHEFGWGDGGLGPARRRHHRRPHHRVRRPVHGRQLQPLLGGSGPLERRLPDRRGARGRHFRGHQARRARAAW